MHAQLVGAARLGKEGHAGGAVFALQHPPCREGRFAVLVADHLKRAVGPVTAQGQVDGALVLRDFALDPRDVAFLDDAPLELQAEIGLGGMVVGHDDDAGCIHIQTVDDADIGPAFFGPRFEAVEEVRRLAGDGEQARRFVENDDIVVVMDDPQRSRGRAIVEGGSLYQFIPFPAGGYLRAYVPGETPREQQEPP